MSVSFAETDLQLKASYTSSPFCTCSTSENFVRNFFFKKKNLPLCTLSTFENFLLESANFSGSRKLRTHNSVWATQNSFKESRHKYVCMCDMTHLYVWHDSFICVTWLIHMCDMPQTFVGQKVLAVTWLIYSYVRHDTDRSRAEDLAATRCNTLQLTATHCNTLQHTATHCNSLQHTATQTGVRQKVLLQHTTTHCNTLQLTAAHCKTLQHTATHCNTNERRAEGLAATHCNTLQLTATHCITLQHTATGLTTHYPTMKLTNL